MARQVMLAMALAVVLVHGGPAMAANTVTCGDAGKKVKVEYDIRFEDSQSRGAGSVSRVHGWFPDFEISTDASESGRQPETISDQKSDYERLEIDLEDPAIAKIVLRLRLYRDFRYDDTDKQYAEHVVAGTLSVMGEGVWAVTCTGW
jgi:hypothetical protein